MARRLRALIFALLPLLLAAGIAQAQSPAAPMPLRLQVGTFDPLYEGASTASTADAATPYQIVQFRGPVEPAWAAQAEAVGATLLGYLPENAYVARATPEAVAKLRSLPSVRWVGPYRPAYKLAPALGRAARALAVDGGLAVTVVAFPGEDPAALAALLAAQGATLDELAATPLGVIARATLPADALAAVAQAPAVSWVEPYVAPQLANAQGRKIMNAESVWSSNGLFGAGQIVAISDSGLDVQGGGGAVASPDLAGRLVRAFAPSQMRPDSAACAAKTTWTDLNGHGTHVAGSVLGSGANSGSDAAARQFTGSEAGVAPLARYVFMAMNTDGSAGIQCVPSNGNYIAFGYENGARISSNSWGGNSEGAYTFNDSVVDDYIWRNRDYLVLFAAGNSGPGAGTVGSPGSAKNIISVGASESNRPDLGGSDPVNGGGIADNPNTMAFFSSRGPTDDGRIKPDIVAPGTNIVSVLGGQARGLSPIAAGRPYAVSSGTSMATPLTAGAATLVREWLTTQRGAANPSAALLKALLIHGAAQLPGAAVPNPSSGWGRVDLKQTIGASYSVFEDDQAGLSSGGSRTFSVEVVGATADATLFADPARPPAGDLGLVTEPLAAAAAQPGPADPADFAAAALPGHAAPPPARPIRDEGAGPREGLPPVAGLGLPDLAGARTLLPAPDGPAAQNFLQSMVGGGDFEDPAWGATWSQVWLGEGRPVRTSSAGQVIAGGHSIWLGGSDSDDLIAYPLSFPATIDDDFPSSLSFLVRQTNLDRGFDYFCVALVDAAGSPISSATGPLLSCTDALPGGVQPISFAFTPEERAALAGETGYLYLFTYGDGELPHMSAFVDNIALDVDFAPISLRAVPSSGPAGTTFLLSGANNVPYGPVSICVSSCASGANLLATVYADARGDAQAYITSSADTAPGSYVFETRNIAGRTGRTAFTILGAAQPTLSVEPATGRPGDEFTFSGERFLPNDPEISVQVNGSTLGTVSSNAEGAVRFRITTRSTSPAGAYTVRVTDGAGRAAEVGYTLLAPDAASPRLSVAPASGPAGTSFTFDGAGFAPGAPVGFTLEGTPIGETTPADCGCFRVALETQASLAPGSYTLAAEQGARRASASFTIVAGGAPAGGNGLAVTLVWTDPPGQPGAARALVNNLNLRVEGPGGQVWLGNGGSSADAINNVETVRIAQPAPGTYRIVVQAAAVNATYGAQPFALVATTGTNRNAGLGTVPLGGNKVYLPLLRR